MDMDSLLNMPPYSLKHEDKEIMLTGMLKELTEKHRQGCREYRDILNTLGYNDSEVHSLADIPFLPVRLFKEYYLHSVPEEKITTTMTSSGTSGQQVSRIALDAETSAHQKKVLHHIIASYIGEKRVPLLILDSKATLRDRKSFGARGAGILGFSIFGRDVTYALDAEMQLDLQAVQAFLDKHKGEPKLLFGYTFIIWQHFYMELQRQGVSLDFEDNAKLFHIGGWKKLKEMAVDDATYQRSLKERCRISSVHNYYGMAEQLGSVYVTCEYGHMHASNFSDVLIRNPLDWSLQPQGKQGLIELVSVLPGSYPGHAILTEDEGVILGEDDCPCGRKGKYFQILGRVKQAELRGCSDTYADKLARR